MLNNKGLEIFRGKEDELKARFEKDGYNWEEVKSKLEGIERSEQIDSKLNELEGKTEDYYNYLKGLIDRQLSENQNGQSSGKIENPLEAKITEAEKLALSKVEGLKKIPIIGDFIYDIAKNTIGNIKSNFEIKENSSFFEDITRKIKIGFGTFILGLFGIKNIEDLFSGVKDSSSETTQSQVNKPSEGLENVENDFSKIPDLYYKGGFEAIVSLSGVALIENVDKNLIIGGLSNVKYEDFIKFGRDNEFINNILGEKKDNQDIRNQYLKIFEALNNDNVKDLLRITFSNNIISNIFSRKSDKLKLSFGEERFNFIKDMLSKGNFDYKKLTLKEISILYVESIPAFGNLGLLSAGEGLSNFSSGIVNLFGNGFNLEKYKNNDISENLVSSLLKNGGGREKLNESKEEVIKSLGLENNNDIEEFGKIYEFKNYILSDLLNNPKLMINSTQKSMIENRLNYKWVFSLYSVMGGNKLEDLSSINLPIISFLISEIISSGAEPSSYLESSNYLVNFYKTIILGNKDFFTEDEERIFKIYGQKIMDIVALKYLGGFYSNLGIFTDSKSLLTTGIVSFAGGAGLNYLGNKGISRAISKGRLPFLSRFAKRLGVLGMGAGVIMGGLSVVSGDGDLDKFDRDLGKYYNNNDIKGFLETLQKHQDGIKEYEKVQNGEREKVKLVHYDSSSPYIIYKGKPYLISLFNTTTDLSGDKTNNGWVNTIVTSVGLVERNTKINGNDISKITFDSKNNQIILGDNYLSVPIDNLLGGNWQEKKINMDLLSKINHLVESINEDYQFSFGTGETLKIIDTGLKIGDDFMIGLIPLDIKEEELAQN